MWRLLFFDFVSGMFFCLEGACLGSLCCIEAVVAEAIGLLCSLMRVNPPARLGQSDLSQGLCPLRMRRPRIPMPIQGGIDEIYLRGFIMCSVNMYQYKEENIGENPINFC